MRTKNLLVGCGLALLALTGCNQQEPSAPLTSAGAHPTPGSARMAQAADQEGATPESRVTAFLNEMTAAMTDPTISDPTTQSKWVEKLVSNYEPDKRAALQPKMAELAAKFSTMFTGQGSPDPNLKVTIQGKIEDLKLETTNPTPDTAMVTLVSGTCHLDINVKGTTANNTSVDSNKPVDLPLNNLVGNKPATLVKVNNVWYMIKKDEQQADVASAPKSEAAPSAPAAADAAAPSDGEAQPAKADAGGN